ncbi:hypothetical protein [Sphingobium nicotianae]|uniref:DUF4440 domain-containing protein n=1 Tax=Sphingobium nicotianae TaxID=2782607 RepID=A0A9X1IPR4_9SPHN|nr:hypothetical protein [Sphingobium nicotianae]MBT2186030.1 hypothetical protein [Sphingobium nicotianae]
MCLRYSLAPILLVAAVQPAVAKETVEDPVLAPVMRFQKAFNAAQEAMPTDVFLPNTVVADGFAPFLWNSKEGLGAWYGILRGTNDAERKTFVSNKYNLTIKAAVARRIDGDTAYLVFPAINRWTEAGKPRFERAYWLITEQRTSDGWRISSHSWAIVSAK